EPMAYEVLHVPGSLVPGLSKADLENRSFYELLEERYGIVIASGNQTIEPTVTTEEESQLLAVPLHTPAFLFERTTVAESDRFIAADVVDRLADERERAQVGCRRGQRGFQGRPSEHHGQGGDPAVVERHHQAGYRLRRIESA